MSSISSIFTWPLRVSSFMFLHGLGFELRWESWTLNSYIHNVQLAWRHVEDCCIDGTVECSIRRGWCSYCTSTWQGGGVWIHCRIGAWRHPSRKVSREEIWSFGCFEEWIWIASVFSSFCGIFYTKYYHYHIFCQKDCSLLMACTECVLWMRLWPFQMHIVGIAWMVAVCSLQTATSEAFLRSKNFVRTICLHHPTPLHVMLDSGSSRSLTLEESTGKCFGMLWWRSYSSTVNSTFD